MELHPNLRPVGGLIGTWNGPGRGEYPTIESFRYVEELTFAHVGKPFLAYAQRTWSPTGQPMHMESGFLRVPAEGVVEVTLAQPTGQVELAEGRLEPEAEGIQIEVQAQLLNSTTAKHVQATRRRMLLRGDTLHTEFAMAAVGHPLTHHLSSELTRQ